MARAKQTFGQIWPACFWPMLHTKTNTNTTANTNTRTSKANTNVNRLLAGNVPQITLITAAAAAAGNLRSNVRMAIAMRLHLFMIEWRIRFDSQNICSADYSRHKRAASVVARVQYTG